MTKYTIKNFSSVAALNDYCDNTPAVKGWTCAASTTGSARFTGTENYDEARRLSETGCPDIVKGLKNNLSKFQSARVQPRRATFDNICGYLPNVPAYIAGRPLSMYDSRPNPIKTKVLDIIYCVSVDYSKNTAQMIEAGSAVIQAIQDLESAGYRCNLYCNVTCVFDSGSRVVSISTRVKNSTEYFNLSRISYAVANPSYLRRHAFKVIETLGLEYYNKGYGYVSNTEFRNSLKPGQIGIAADELIGNPGAVTDIIKRQIKQLA